MGKISDFGLKYGKALIKEGGRTQLPFFFWEYPPGGGGGGKTTLDGSLKGLGHAILGNFSTDPMVIELTKISK